MKKNTTLALICASLFLLQGCTHVKKTDDSATNGEAAENTQTIQPASSEQSGSSARLTSLQKCLNDANTLIKLDNKYQKNYNELYILINDAKLYASLSNETSDNVKATIAPLFEYEINDRCNNISQQLINAFKNKIKQNSMLNGNS